MNDLFFKLRFLLALLLFFFGQGLIRSLNLQNEAYFVTLFLTYGICGALLCPPLVDRGRGGRLFWALAAVGLLIMMLLPLLPFHIIPYGARAFLLYSHVEIFPAFLLGICLAALVLRKSSL